MSTARMGNTARPMIQFYTKEFFEEIARRLNADAEWGRSVAGKSFRMVCTAIDKHRSFLIAVTQGKVVASDASTETRADYRFEGRYEAWMSLCKGQAEMDRLIQQGKIRLAGSMSDLMGFMGPLNRIVLTARSFPKEF